MTPSSTSSPSLTTSIAPSAARIPPSYGATLERRTRRRRGGHQPLAVGQDDLAVGPDVDEEGPFVAVHPGRDHAGDDVAADIGAGRGKSSTRAPGWRSSPISLAWMTGEGRGS